MTMSKNSNRHISDLRAYGIMCNIHNRSIKESGCLKVTVASCIVFKDNSRNIQSIAGYNSVLGDRCRRWNICHRVELYGDDSKAHRLPSDCLATHSEISAIALAAKLGLSTNGAAIIVTRYPCEACARAIVACGINEVIYGREEKISDMTARIFKDNDVRIRHLVKFKAEDKNT